MNRVEPVPVLAQELQRIALMELKRIVRLRDYVHADHLKTRPCVAHPCPASAAKQIQQSRFLLHLLVLFNRRSPIVEC